LFLNDLEFSVSLIINERGVVNHIVRHNLFRLFSISDSLGPIRWEILNLLRRQGEIVTDGNSLLESAANLKFWEVPC